MLNFLATLILMVTPTIEVSKAPVAPGLPEYVQTMPAGEYEAWAVWQNQLSLEKAKKDARYSYEQPFYTVNRTTINARSGGFARSSANGVTSRQSSRGQSTSARNANTRRSQSRWRTLTSATVPTRYRNPYYVPVSVMIYSPYVKSTSERRPDWDNLFIPFKGGAITVSEALKLHGRPIAAERLFRLMMLPEGDE